MLKHYSEPLFMPLLILLLGFVLPGTVMGADTYRVSLQVFHFGELIAQPSIEVEAGKTMGGQFAAPGERQYKFLVLVRPAANDQVSVSMQFSAGTLNIQPNLLVDLDQETPATIDKVRLVLLVQNSVKPGPLERIALHD